MLTAQEVADRLNLTVYTVNAYLRDGTIPGATKFGGRWRVDADQFDTWYRTRLTPGKRQHGFSPRSSRSHAAKRGRETVNRRK